MRMSVAMETVACLPLSSTAERVQTDDALREAVPSEHPPNLMPHCPRSSLSWHFSLFPFFFFLWMRAPRHTMRAAVCWTYCPEEDISFSLEAVTAAWWVFLFFLTDTECSSRMPALWTVIKVCARRFIFLQLTSFVRSCICPGHAGRTALLLAFTGARRRSCGLGERTTVEGLCQRPLNYNNFMLVKDLWLTNKEFIRNNWTKGLFLLQSELLTPRRVDHVGFLKCAGMLGPCGSCYMESCHNLVSTNPLALTLK